MVRNRIGFLCENNADGGRDNVPSSPSTIFSRPRSPNMRRNDKRNAAKTREVGGEQKKRCRVARCSPAPRNDGGSQIHLSQLHSCETFPTDGVFHISFFSHAAAKHSCCNRASAVKWWPKRSTPRSVGKDILQ